MSVNIRFDYYNLKVDKCRKRRSSSGQNYFNGLSLNIFCEKLYNYVDNNAELFINEKKRTGKTIVKLKNNKKWIKLISVNIDEDNPNIYKMLLTFSDTEADHRLLDNGSSTIVSQPIPDSYGVRTLVHLIIKLDAENNEANFCIQSVNGLSKKYILNALSGLFNLVFNEEDLVCVDPMTQQEHAGKVSLELHPITTSSILDAVNQGLLKGIDLVEREKVSSPFDEYDIFKDCTKHIGFSIKDEKSWLSRLDSKEIKNFITRHQNRHANQFQGKPKTYLIIKNESNNGETRYEYNDDITAGLSKRVFLNWEDRNIETIKALEQQEPKSICQCYAKMIQNF